MPRRSKSKPVRSLTPVDIRPAGIDRPMGEKMPDTTMQEKKKRIAPRSPTEAAITCRPYGSTGAVRTADGVMRNFSSGGSYIETTDSYLSGTILIVRMVRYPSISLSIDEDECPRTICLAEVKWRQAVADETAIRYGIGLRYLD